MERWLQPACVRRCSRHTRKLPPITRRLKPALRKKIPLALAAGAS